MNRKYLEISQKYENKFNEERKLQTRKEKKGEDKYFKTKS